MHIRSPRSWRASAAVVAAVALVLTGCSQAKDVDYTPPEQAEGEFPADTVAQLEDAVVHAMAATGATGAIVGVWAPWSGSWVSAQGTQSVADTDPVSADMTFRIADVTRMMTCDVLFGLAEEGSLELGDPISDYVSSVPNLTDVTLIELCDGTSGLGMSAPTAEAAWLNTPGRVWNVRELATYGVARDGEQRGQRFDGSDAGYLLLGQAMERASGKNAATLIHEYVAAPLQLESTLLPPSTPDSTGLHGNVLEWGEAGWQCDAPRDITWQSSSLGYTDSGVVSTIHDLGRYVQATAAQALGTEGRWDTPLPAADDAPSWFQATGGAYQVGPLVGQHGWVPGYSVAAYSDPATGFTVAVVLNNSTAGAGMISALAWELAAIASKAPAAPGQTAPSFALPFTAEQYREQIAAGALCPLPGTEEPPVEETAPEGEAGEEG